MHPTDPDATTPYHPTAPPPSPAGLPAGSAGRGPAGRPSGRRPRPWPPWAWAALVFAAVLLVGLPCVIGWGHWEVGRLAAPGGVPTVTAGELVRDFDAHKGKRVRVRGECVSSHVPGEYLTVHLGGKAPQRFLSPVVCHCRPEDAPEFAGGGEVTVEGVVATERSRHVVGEGQVELSGCRRVYP